MRGCEVGGRQSLPPPPSQALVQSARSKAATRISKSRHPRRGRQVPVVRRFATDREGRARGRSSTAKVGKTQFAERSKVHGRFLDEILQERCTVLPVSTWPAYGAGSHRTPVTKDLPEDLDLLILPTPEPRRKVICVTGRERSDGRVRLGRCHGSKGDDLSRHHTHAGRPCDGIALGRTTSALRGDEDSVEILRMDRQQRPPINAMQLRMDPGCERRIRSDCTKDSQRERGECGSCEPPDHRFDGLFGSRNSIRSNGAARRACSRRVENMAMAGYH